MVRVDRVGVDREERARNRGERRGESVHVVEQVERVRDPDQPDDADHCRGDVVADDLDADAGRENERCGRALRRELRERRELVEIVDEAREEEDPAAAEDAAELRRRRDGARGEGDPGGREEAGHDADAAEERRRARVPAVFLRCGDETTGRGVCRSPRIVRKLAGSAASAATATVTAESVTKRCMDGVWAGSAHLAVLWPGGPARAPALPFCGSTLLDDGPSLHCGGCARIFDRSPDGIPLMLHAELAGAREKLREAEGWLEKARAEGWYEPDDTVDRVLPFVNRELGWNDPNWLANGHSFEILLGRYLESATGLRVLEVGAAKAWAAPYWLARDCEFVATDILVDGKIGLGRGAFYGEFGRVQADGEALPFADKTFDVTYCVATLHHALDLTKMVREMVRVTKPGGIVAGLNEGIRGVGRSARIPSSRVRRSSASTSTCTRCGRTSPPSRGRALSCAEWSAPTATRLSRSAGRSRRCPRSG